MAKWFYKFQRDIWSVNPALKHRAERRKHPKGRSNSSPNSGKSDQLPSCRPIYRPCAFQPGALAPGIWSFVVLFLLLFFAQTAHALPVARLKSVKPTVQVQGTAKPWTMARAQRDQFRRYH